MMKHHTLTLLACAAMLMAALTSCSSTESPAAAASHMTTEYDLFVAKGGYPVTPETYRDEALLKKANSSSPIYICLGHQRGRLYVDGQVAADWPVSTGIPGRDTPTGKFHITFKEPNHSSGRYGKIYNAAGSCVNGNADSLKDSVPAGGKFVGAPMPYWMRLTSDGVGMHTGKVSAGRRLSHGCIRTPNAMAAQLYGITAVGTPVTVSHDIESVYPSRDALNNKHKLLKAKEEAEAQAVAEAKAAKAAAQVQ